MKIRFASAGSMNRALPSVWLYAFSIGTKIRALFARLNDVVVENEEVHSKTNMNHRHITRLQVAAYYKLWQLFA